MELIDEINNYDEMMLRLQFEISEIFSHQLTKGEAREDFLKEYMMKKAQSIKIVKGSIFHNDSQSTQLDIIICDQNSVLNTYGNQTLIDADYCKTIVEVKSRLKKEYLNDLAQVSYKIKKMNSKTKIGIFSYCLGQSRNSIIKHFGYIYDKDLDMYEYDDTCISNEYKMIDFIVCIDEVDEFVIIKENEEFRLCRDKPVIKYLWPLIKN